MSQTKQRRRCQRPKRTNSLPTTVVGGRDLLVLELLQRLEPLQLREIAVQLRRTQPKQSAQQPQSVRVPLGLDKHDAALGERAREEREEHRLAVRLMHRSDPHELLPQLGRDDLLEVFHAEPHLLADSFIRAHSFYAARGSVANGSAQGAGRHPAGSGRAHGAVEREGG